MGSLEVEPKLRRCIKRFCKQPCRIRRYASFPPDTFINSLNRNAYGRYQCFLCKPQWFKEFFQENDTRMRGCMLLTSSVKNPYTVRSSVRSQKPSHDTVRGWNKEEKHHKKRKSGSTDCWIPALILGRMFC